MAQWLRLYTPNAGDLGLIAGQGTRSHEAQVRVPMSRLKKKKKKSWVPQVRPSTAKEIKQNKYIFLIHNATSKLMDRVQIHPLSWENMSSLSKQTWLASFKPWLITVNCYLPCKVQNISLLFPQNRKQTSISHFSRNYRRCHWRMTRHH